MKARRVVESAVQGRVLVGVPHQMLQRPQLMLAQLFRRPAQTLAQTRQQAQAAYDNPQITEHVQSIPLASGPSFCTRPQAIGRKAAR